MATMQEIIDRGRVPLNDTAKTRFTDPVLLRFANDFLQIARRERPDLFFGTYATPHADLAVGGAFPLESGFESAAADYVTGRAEATGSEAELEARAVAFLKMAGSGLGVG